MISHLVSGVGCMSGFLLIFINSILGFLISEVVCEGVSVLKNQ